MSLTFYSNTKTLEHRCSHTLGHRNSRAQMVPYCKAQLVHRYWAPIALDSNERKPRHITGTTGPMQSFYRIICPCRTQINNARNVHSHMEMTYCVSIKYLWVNDYLQGESTPRVHQEYTKSTPINVKPSLNSLTKCLDSLYVFHLFFKNAEKVIITIIVSRGDSMLQSTRWWLFFAESLGKWRVIVGLPQHLVSPWLSWVLFHNGIERLIKYSKSS